MLTSGSDQVLDLIGFHPKRIILTGDSAGGNLSPAVTFVLNDIRRMGAESPLMPVALAVQYPAPDPTLIFDASKTMVTFDPLLSTSKMLTFLSAYHGIPVTPEDPWFRKKVLLAEVSNQLAYRARDPYYNLLAYKHLKDLRHLPLYVTACEFDALLDGAIAFAKVWQGPVTLDIAQGLPHGFLIGAGRKEVQFEIERCISRIREGLGLEADDAICDDESVPPVKSLSLFSKISAAKIF
jgi:acetyl esterase/lipase